jgi:hypothetical protein
VRREQLNMREAADIPPCYSSLNMCTRAIIVDFSIFELMIAYNDAE